MATTITIEYDSGIAFRYTLAPDRFECDLEIRNRGAVEFIALPTLSRHANLQTLMWEIALLRDVPAETECVS